MYMLKADAKRIAWFLGLQRIVSFPRSFMAPPTITRPSRGLLASDLETASRGILPSRSDHTTSARSSGSKPSSLPMLKRAASPINVPGLTTVRRFVSATVSRSTSGLPPWRLVSNSNFTAKPPQALENHTEHKIAARQEFLTLKKINPFIGSLDNIGFRSKKPIPLAPIHASSLGQGFREFEPHSDTQPTTKANGEITFVPPHQLPSEDATGDQGPADQYPPASPDRDATTTAGDQSKRTKSSVSTLHIDGSALGRWTVQHLERALGKPATGMTGVDPRASIPRSRVAPF
jgi:hypothetical protein